MATEAHTTEPVALLERGANNQLTAAEFNQPAEIANYLVKSENVKTSIDAVVESGIKGNAGAPEGGSFYESPTVAKVLVVKEIQRNEDLDAAEGTATKDNGVADEIEEIEGKGITNNETVEVKNEYADAVANVQDLVEEKQTGWSEQNEEEGKKTDESVEQETIREVSSILEARLGPTNEAVIDTNEQKLNDSDDSVDKITDGIENERKNAATSTDTEVIEERSLGMAISINQNDNREVEVIENKINEPPVLLTSVACKEEHEETEILDKTGEADGSESVKPKEEKNLEQKFDDLVSKHEEGKQNVIKEQISSDASAGEGRDENVHTVIAAEDNIAEVAALEEMPSPKKNLIHKDEPENEKIESSEKVSKETETAASNEIKNQEDCTDEAKEEKSNDTDIISDSGIPNEEISPPTTLDEKARNADVERENKNADDQHPTRSLEQEITLPEGKKLEKSSDFKHQELVDNESGVSTKEETTPKLVSETKETEDEKLKHVSDSKENLDIKDAGKNTEEGDLQVEISATSSNDTESKDEENSVFNDNIVEQTFEPENIQEAETKLQAEVGENVKEKIPEENVESNSQESVDEDQTEDLQSDDKMTGQPSTENFEEHGTARTIDNVVKETNQIDGITNLTEQECLQSENRTLAVETITNVKEDTDKEGPREDIKDKEDQSRELSEEIASKDDIIEVQEIIQTMAEAEDSGKQDSVVEDKIEVIAREMHEDPLQEEKGDDLDSTKLKEEIEDSKTEFTESIEERGYVEERESETLKDNEEPNSELTPAKASEETTLQKDVNESLAKIPTLEPESKEETLEREKYDIDDSNNAPTTTKETILEEGESEDKVEMQSSNLPWSKEPIEISMESDKLHQMYVDAESENATNLDGGRDPEIAVVENEVEEQIEHEIQTEAPIEGTEDQTNATASETPSAYMSDDILKECSAMPSQESEFVSSEASEIVDEDAEEKSKTSLTEVVEEEKAGTYNNELEAADSEIITQQECASKTMTGEESQEIICDTNQSELGEKMTDFKNESSEFVEQKSQGGGHHETQEKQELEEPREHVKETQDADEIVKAVILTEEVQDVEEADGEDKTVKLANDEKEVIKESHNELTEAEGGEKAEESIPTEQSKESDFNEQRETVSSDAQEASVMENEILIAKQTEVKREQDEAGGKSTGDSSTAAVQQSEEKKREITEGADSPCDKIKETTTSENSLEETQIDEKTAQDSKTTEDESSTDTVDVEASQKDDVVNRIAVEENSSNLASHHLAENNENATDEQIEDADADEAEERKKASDVDVVHESVGHYVEDVNAGESIEEVKEDSETEFKSRNIEALEKCEVSADQTVTEKRTKEEELTPSPEIPSKEEYEIKTVQNEEESTKEVGIVYESSVKSSASNSTNETCKTKEEHRAVCVSEFGLDSPNEVHEENKGTLDEKVEVKETSETTTLSNSQSLEAVIEHVVACDQTFHEDKGQEHEEVCIQTNESRELEASQPSLEFNEDKKDESQDETDEKKEAPGVISEASIQTLPVQRIDGQNQTSSELLSEEQDGISASMDVVAEEEISSDKTPLTEKLKEQETLSEQEHVASATIESEESSKEVEVVVVDDETKTTKEVSSQMEVPEQHEIQKESPKEVREDEDSGESREDIKEAAGLSSRPDSQDLKAPKEDEIASDTTLVTEEKSEAKSQTPSDAMIDGLTPATSEHIEQHMQEGENIEKSACFSTEGTKEVEALEVEIEKVNVNEVSNKDGGTPEEVLKLKPHENPTNEVESEVITGSEVQSYEKTRESEESEVKEKHLVAAIPDFVQTNQPKETVDATDVAGNDITNEEVADKKEEWESSSPATLNEETTKESSQLHEPTTEERLGDDMIEKEIQNKNESGAEISDVKESVGEVEISSDENLPIAKSGEPSEIPSAQEKPEEYVEVTTKEVEVVEDESSRTESVSLPKEGDTKLETCHSKCPLDAEEQKKAPEEVHEEEDIAHAESREEIKKYVECESVPNSDSQGFESTKDEIVSGDTLATGKTLEEQSKTPSADLVFQITTLLEETEDQAKPEETQGDNKLQTKEQEFQGLALEKEGKEEGEVPDEAFKLESQENQTVIEEREFLTKNEEIVELSKETSNLKTKISEKTSKSESEIYGSDVKDTQREEAITNDTTEPMLKEVINEGITKDKDDAKGTPLIIGSDVTTKECHQEPEEKPGESLEDQKTKEEPQTEEEVDTEISNTKDAVEYDTITTDTTLPVAKLDEIQSVALVSEEQKQATSGTTDFIKEVEKGVEGTEEPKATEEVPLQKEEPSELGVSQVETQLDKYVLEAPKEIHEGEATTKQMEVIGDVPVIMEEASWQKEVPRGSEISESKRPLDADVQMDSQKEIHEEEDSAPIETKEEIKEQEVGTEILDTEEAVEDKITSDKNLLVSKLEDEKKIQSVALFAEEQKHVTSATTECIKEVMKGVEGTEDEPKTTEEVPLQKEEPGELGLSQLETRLEIYTEETPKEVHEREATTKKVEIIGDIPNIIEEASLQKEEPRGAEISESKQLLDADVQKDSQKEVHEEEEKTPIETKEEIKEEEVSTEISESKEAVEEDKNTSDKSLPFVKLEEQNEIQSVALLSEEQKQGTSATTDCIKEVMKGVEGTEVEPKTTEEVPLRKEEPRELEVFQEETQLNKYVQETLKEVHEGEANTKEVEVIVDVPNIVEEAPLRMEEPKEPEISESYRLLDADVKMDSQNEVHAEEKSYPIKTEEEVESNSMSNSDSQVFEAPKEDKITSAETLATEEKSEEQSQIPFAALVSETTPPSEKEEQGKAVETPEDDNLQNSATPNDQEVLGLVLDTYQSLEEEKTQDEAVKLASEENKTNIKDDKSLHESERVTEIVGLPERTANIKNEISEETLESESEIHSNEVITAPGKTETKSEIYGSEGKDTQREEAITNDTTELMLKEVINEGITEDKDDAKGTPLIIGSDVTTKECHQEPEEKPGESLGDQKTTKEPQTEEEVDTEISNAKDAVEDNTITTDKSLPVAKLDEIQSVALLSEEQKQGTSGITDFIKEVEKGVEGTEEPKATEEVPSQKEEPSELGVSQVETQLDKYVLEAPKEIHEGEATTKQMEVIGDVPVIMEEASWQKEEPRGSEISESKRPLDADVQMDSQKEIHEEEDSAPIETKEEIKEQEVGTEILDTEEAVEEYKITSDKSLLDSKFEDEKEIQSVALFSEEQKHVTSATTECIKEMMKGVEGTEDEPKTTEEVPLQKEEPGELGLSQLETRLEIYTEETPKEVHEGEATTKKVEIIGDIPNIIKEASLQKEEPRGAEISESNQLLDADVQKDSQKEVHEEEEKTLIETKEEIKEEEVSTEISESKEAVEEDKNTSDKSLPFAKLEEQNEIQSVALLSEEQKQGTSATDCIKEVTKGVEGTEVEPKTTEEVPLRKEEPRELEVFQEETQLNKYVQETLKEEHDEEEETTKEVEVIGDVPNIMEEASLQKEEHKEPEISESYRLLDADVKMDSQNEVHAEEKSSPIKSEEEVESKSMSNSDSQVFEAPKEDKITSAETVTTEEKSEEQSQIPFSALVSETTSPSEKEEQGKAVETPEDDNLQNSATPNDLEVLGLVLDKDQSLEEEKTQDEAVKLDSEENKTNIKDENSLKETERVTEIVGLPERTANIKNEISEETLESESEIHSNEVNTEPGKTETKEEEAIATKIVDNEVINDEVPEDKDALTVSEVTTTECHQEPQPNLDESLKDKTIEELQTKEDFCTEKSDAKEEIVEEKVTSDKGLLMAKSEEKIQIQLAALRLEEQTQGASATIESRKEAMEDIEGIIDEPKTTEEVPLRKEAHSALEGSKLETPVSNCILESPKEIQQEKSEVTGKTREETKGASEIPLKSDSNEIEDKSDSNSKEISAALASETTTILEKIEDPKREVEILGNENPEISMEESKETEEGEVPGEASKLENQENKSKTTHAECPPQPETTSNLKAEQPSKLDSEIHSYEVVPKPVETEIIENLPEEEKIDMQQNTIDTVNVQQINLTDKQDTESKQGTIIESQQKNELKPENNKAAKDIQNEKVEKSQEEERKTANATSGDKKTSEAEERGTAEGKFSLQDMLEKSTRQWPHAAEETEEAEKAKSGWEEEDAEEEQKKCDSSGSDAPVMVEACREMEIKTPQKKSLLSGVGSKVKHSISKVKKAITGSGGKTSSQAKQQHSPK